MIQTLLLSKPYFFHISCLKINECSLFYKYLVTSQKISLFKESLRMVLPSPRCIALSLHPVETPASFQQLVWILFQMLNVSTKKKGKYFDKKKIICTLKKIETFRAYRILAQHLSSVISIRAYQWNIIQNNSKLGGAGDELFTDFLGYNFSLCDHFTGIKLCLNKQDKIKVTQSWIV